MSPISRLSALPARLALLLALVVALPACDSGSTAPTDEILFGLNYSRLFAPATAAEISTVRADWAARATSTTPATIVSETVIDGARVAIIQHDVTAVGCGTVTHYAAVRIPAGLTGTAPLLVVHHGGDRGVNVGVGASSDRDQTANTSLVKMVAAFPDLFAQTVQVLPVYRSEELRTAGYAALGGPYVAGGTPSPWDCDVDDAIATVQAVAAAFPAEVDAARRAAIGFSRGGNTAALHTVRDPQMAALVDYYGPTDFYNNGAQLLATGVLGGSSAALALPGAMYLRDNVLQPLIGAGRTYNPDADYATARLEVVRRSASLFTPDLPDTQVHHHYRDGVVPYAFSAAFQAGATARGTGGSFELFPYGMPTSVGDTATDPTFHAPESNPTSIPRVQSFLQAALGAARPADALVLAY